MVLVSLPAVPVAQSAEPNRLTTEERRAGWRLLFDGTTSAGWLEVTGKPFPTNCWTIENGCLKALVRTDGFQDIRTAETFRRFDLQFDWMLKADGNSGVKYLIQNVDEWMNQAGRQARARGLEYQLADNHNEDAASDPRRVAGALYSLIAPRPGAKPKIGKFNHSRLLVDGRHVEHWLNDVKVVEFETTAPEVQKLLRAALPKGSGASTPLAEGSPISLQNHASETWFRSIKIRVLR
jgi:hypothetical protein